MGLSSKKRTSNDQAPMYTGPELEQFLDGFRTGMPLVGQPDYPVHNTPAYTRGLTIGRQRHEAAGSPQIPYEEEAELTYNTNCVFCSGKCTGH